jgi:putative Ca2+/H+ antiporter (TMEM165/GDT1 family)
LEALLFSTVAVCLAEIGDKTQLLALVLAARFRKPWPIMAGILFATLANHTAAAWAGAWLSGWLSPQALGWLVGGSFLAIAAWTLVPDRLEEGAGPKGRHGAFLTTLVAFFLVEIGDKTQVATVALALKYPQTALVVVGTTLGMLLANAPAVGLGSVTARRIPLRAVRYAAGAIFAGLGIATLARFAFA